MEHNGTKRPAAVGDVVVVEGRHVGGGRRTGEIIEVLGEGERAHYRVRWEDDRETIFYPGSGDATIQRHEERCADAPSTSAEKAVHSEYEDPVLTHEP